MDKEGCVFCRIISKEIDTPILKETKNFVVINDANPVSEGHCLIIPKNHYKDLFELPEGFGQELLSLAKAQGERLLEKGDIEGIKLVQNNGRAAGQAVFHYHLHVIPESKTKSREKTV